MELEKGLAARRRAAQAYNEKYGFRLYFFQGGDPHPLLGKVDPATGLSLNDKFRAIHDLFGHAAEGYGLAPAGKKIPG